MFSLGAGEPPGVNRLSTATTIETPPIRIVLVSTTNIASRPGMASPHLHRSPLQWTIIPTTDGRRFGKSIATADIDGDGLLDLFVGQPRGSTTRNPGSVSIYAGSVTVPFSGKPTVMEGMSKRDMFGLSLANVGDVNGDGLADVAIGAPEHSSSQTSEGGLAMIHGRYASLPLRPDFQFGSGHPGVQLGISVASAGDVNGDGFDDVLIGAPRHPVRSFQEGVAYLCSGSRNGLVVPARWEFYGNQREAHCGQAVANAGDVNGDGFSDVLVGMPDFDTPQTDAGRVLLFLGSKSGLKDTPDWSADGPHAHARFGAALASAGDLNGDGFNDVLIGAPGVGDEVKVSGWVFAYLGTGSSFSKSPAWAVSDSHEGARFGAAITGLGDINGDQHADVLIGEPGFDGRYAEQGRACLYLGSGRGLHETPDWILEGGQPGAECGTCVASVSDFNRDGLNDFAVGSPAYSTLRTKEGRVDIFLGSRTAFDRRNEFPPDGTNSAALTRELFKPVQPALPIPAPGLSAKVIYAVAAGLLLTLGLGLILWRRHSRAHVEKERNRLARDLHDDLGARLARVSMLTELVKRDSAQTDEARKNAETLAEATREVLDAMEQILQSVDPKNDTLENFVTFIVQYAEPFFAPTNIRCRHETPLQLPARNIRPAVRKNLFLAVKEALHNLAKHSGATEARINITFSDSLLAIVIEDNGHGIEAARSRQPSHSRRGHGLDNMRARMEEIGGQFLIEARDEGGTRVRLSVKL